MDEVKEVCERLVLCSKDSSWCTAGKWKKNALAEPITGLPLKLSSCCVSDLYVYMDTRSLDSNLLNIGNSYIGASLG